MYFINLRQNNEIALGSVYYYFHLERIPTLQLKSVPAIFKELDPNKTGAALKDFCNALVYLAGKIFLYLIFSLYFFLIKTHSRKLYWELIFRPPHNHIIFTIT